MAWHGQVGGGVKGRTDRAAWNGMAWHEHELVGARNISRSSDRRSPDATDVTGRVRQPMRVRKKMHLQITSAVNTTRFWGSVPRPLSVPSLESVRPFPLGGGGEVKQSTPRLEDAKPSRPGGEMEKCRPDGGDGGEVWSQGQNQNEARPDQNQTNATVTGADEMGIDIQCSDGTGKPSKKHRLECRDPMGCHPRRRLRAGAGCVIPACQGQRPGVHLRPAEWGQRGSNRRFGPMRRYQ
jgi:hypothetical protein